MQDLLIVGTGNGLDALGAIEIFNLDSITVTDLLEKSLARAICPRYSPMTGCAKTASWIVARSASYNTAGAVITCVKSNAPVRCRS